MFQNILNQLKSPQIQQLAMNSAWYPVRGMTFLWQHRELWSYIGFGAITTLAIGLFSLMAVMSIVFVPQMALIAALPLFPSALAWLGSLLLSLAEASALTFFASSFVFDRVQNKVFERTLNILGLPAPSSKRYGTVESSGSQWLNIASWVAFPLNFIPVVGQLLNGVLLSWKMQKSYLTVIKKMNADDQKSFVSDNLVLYAASGFASQIINLIPGLNLISFFSNWIGSALLLADMEHARVPIHGVYKPRWGKQKRSSSSTSSSSSASRTASMNYDVLGNQDQIQKPLSQDIAGSSIPSTTTTTTTSSSLPVAGVSSTSTTSWDDSILSSSSNQDTSVDQSKFNQPILMEESLDLNKPKVDTSLNTNKFNDSFVSQQQTQNQQTATFTD